MLGRNNEALRQSEKALALFPGSVNAHLLRAEMLSALGRRPEAEQELLAAIALSPTEYTWSALAQLYTKEDRSSEAIAAIQKAADLQANPASSYIQLGNYALAAGHPDDALKGYAKALQSASRDEKNAAGASSIRYRSGRRQGRGLGAYWRFQTGGGISRGGGADSSRLAAGLAHARAALSIAGTRRRRRERQGSRRQSYGQSRPIVYNVRGATSDCYFCHLRRGRSI